MARKTQIFRALFLVAGVIAASVAGVVWLGKEWGKETPKHFRDLGIACHEEGDYKGAVGNYTKAIELAPDRPDIYGSRAAAHHRKGELDKARADVKACRKLGGQIDPDFLADLKKASGRKK